MKYLHSWQVNVKKVYKILNCTISIAIFSLCLLCFEANTVKAEGYYLGRYGSVYDIAEPDMFNEIKSKIKPLNVDEMRKSSSTFQPKNIVKLPKATANTVFYVDMSYAIDHNIVDGNGNVLYKKGFMYNPLKYVNYTDGIIAIDGTDPVQVEWFKKSKYASNLKANLLLTDGIANQLGVELNRPVFYLTEDINERLQLKAVPSIAVSNGDVMAIREVLLEEIK